jgi:hypothetical protein
MPKSKPQEGAEPPRAADLRPDGWERFEQAVDAAVRAGPARRPAPAPKPSSRDGACSSPPKVGPAA